MALTITTRTINGYEDFVADKVNLDQLRADDAHMTALDIKLPGFDKLASFRKAHQGVDFYTTWDSSMDLDRALELTREYSAESGFLVEFEEVILDPGMTFIVGKVWV